MIQLINTIKHFIEHSKMKSNDVKAKTCIDSEVKNNDKDPKFKVGDHVRKYENTLQKTTL